MTDGDHDARLGRALERLHAVEAVTPPASLARIVDVVSDIVGARGGRLLVADYALRWLQELDDHGPVGEPIAIEGTLAGHAFALGEVVAAGDDPIVLRVPLVDGQERIGLIELELDEWDARDAAVLAPVIRTVVLMMVANRRYTDAWMRARRALPLSAAAEVQWDLLPPLSASSGDIGVAGILEPAYTIGGDSFDYAFNHQSLDFAIIDAIGHGMSAVLMAVTAINGLRNVRRERGALEASYLQVDELIARQFGDSYYVTGQFGSLDLDSGMLRWINAGHVLPLLVRNGTYAGELTCAPSMPMGLGGPVVQIADEPLQRGDRVLFYTDGITESIAPHGEFFGTARLADYLVRATLDRVSVAETVRRLSANVLAFVGGTLRDDATMFLIEYRAQLPDPT